jgi:hypothetical protein
MNSKWIIKAALGFLCLILVVALVVMWLWNNLLPDLFGFPYITYWQALGLFILSKIFFKSGNGFISKGWMKERIKEKCDQMSPEEKEKFREQWKTRCDKWKSGCDD